MLTGRRRPRTASVTAVVDTELLELHRTRGVGGQVETAKISVGRRRAGHEYPLPGRKRIGVGIRFVVVPGVVEGRDHGHAGRRCAVVRQQQAGFQEDVLEATEDGRPIEIRVHFGVDLEDRSLRWLEWRNGVYIPFEPPSVGESVVLPEVTFPLW